jgi:hypothetical protein
VILTRYVDKAMLRAGKGLVLTRHDVLSKPEFLGQARQEFEQSRLI